MWHIYLSDETTVTVPNLMLGILDIELGYLYM